MRGVSSKSVRKMIAVDIRVILYGVVIGLVVGSLQLGDSVERATALGLAVTIEYSVGLWLAAKIWLAGFPALFAWLDRRQSLHKERLTEAQFRLDRLIEERGAKLGQSANYVESDDPSRRDASAIVARMAMWCILLIPFGITSFTIGSMMAIMNMGLDIHSSAVYVPAMIVGAALASMGIAMPCLNSLIVGRRLAALENKLSSAGDELAMPSLGSAHDLDQVYGWTNSVLGKLIGYKAAA